MRHLTDVVTAPLQVIKPRRSFAVDEDDFLKEPALFRYGPVALIVVSVLLTIGFTLAGVWRIKEGRIGAYNAAFQQLGTTAISAEEALSQYLGRLDQAVKVLEDANQNAAPIKLVQAVQQRLYLQDADVDVVLVTSHGRVLASTRPVASHDEHRRSLAALPVDPSVLKFAPGIGGLFGAPDTLAVTRVLGGTANLRVVFLLQPTKLRNMAQRLYGSTVGALTLYAGNAEVVARAVSGGTELTPNSRPQEVLLSTGQALTPSAYPSSQRVLAAQAQSARGFSVQAAIAEDEAMTEFSGRVKATWQIAIAFGLALMGFGGLTSYAIRQFSTKETYLRRLATVDILTGLPNRRRFHQLLAQALRALAKSNRRPFALFFIDLDNFKCINDSVGHGAGDALLAHVATVLSQNLRKGALVSRLGGDEFTIIVEGIDCDATAKGLGERILTELQSPVDIQGVKISTKASIGVALAPQHGTSAEDLMRYADTAMYQAKQIGKGCCLVYTAAMAEDSFARASLVQRLALAIAENELFLDYQPKFCMDTGALVGHEALVRWRHPERGTVYPGEFITVAEEYGLIEDLGNSVLRMAVAQIRAWHDQGEGWQKVAVNVSALQLRSSEFPGYVKDTLAQYEVPGSCLQIELTESCIANNPTTAQVLIKELRELGAAIAIDDFGTGYSSLSSLQQFEIDYLKVDRSFVTKLHTAQGEEICRAIIALSHALKMCVIAEGVETPEQCEALRQLGCNQVQGYLFAKPMSAEKAVHAGPGPRPSSRELTSPRLALAA